MFSSIILPYATKLDSEHNLLTTFLFHFSCKKLHLFYRSNLSLWGFLQTVTVTCNNCCEIRLLSFLQILPAGPKWWKDALFASAVVFISILYVILKHKYHLSMLYLSTQHIKRPTYKNSCQLLLPSSALLPTRCYYEENEGRRAQEQGDVVILVIAHTHTLMKFITTNKNHWKLNFLYTV